MDKLEEKIDTYEKRILRSCSKDEILELTHSKIDKEIDSIPSIWFDLFYYYLKSEPENLFNQDVQIYVYSKLEELYKSNPKEFTSGTLSGLIYFFQALRSYLDLSDIIRELEPIDYLPEVKTRLYRIPVYTQILEAVFSNILRFLRDILGEIKGKDYSSQTRLRNLKEILDSNGFNKIFDFVDIDARNAINHGGVIISPWEVTFIYSTNEKTDMLKEKTWTVREQIGEVAFAMLGNKKPHFDDIIEGSYDDVGGIIVGILRFLSKHSEIIYENIEQIKKDEILTREYLCRYLSYPGCECKCIDTGIIPHTSQLNLHFFVLETDHKELEKHSIEVGIIVWNWIQNYNKYMVGYRNQRMPPGAIIYSGEELKQIIQGKEKEDNIIRNVKKNGRFLLIFKVNDEDIDLEEIKNFRYPIINGENWKIREIEDASNEKNKRFRANLYIQDKKNKDEIIKIVRTAIDHVKNTKNPASPMMKIKHGDMPADAVYLKVFSKQGRRKNRYISSKNPNFICLVESNEDCCPPLKNGGIPKEIWNELINEEHNKIKFAWNPIFIK